MQHTGNPTPRRPQAGHSATCEMNRDVVAAVQRAHTVRKIGRRQSKAMRRVKEGAAPLVCKLDRVLDELIAGSAPDDDVRAVWQAIAAHGEAKLARRAGPKVRDEAASHEGVQRAAHALTVAQLRRRGERTTTRAREVVSAAHAVIGSVESLVGTVLEEDELSRNGGQSAFRFARA